MRILILHMRYAPDLTGTGPLVTELATGLAARGEDVRVVASVPHYGRGNVPEEYRGGLLRGTIEDGVRVIRTAGFTRGADTVAGRALDYAVYTGLSALAGCRGPSPDVILCISPPLTAGIAGRFVAWWRKAPLVFGVQDIWPDGLIAMGRLRSRVLTRWLRSLELWIYRKSRSIIVLSSGMKENVVAKGVSEAKVIVIPNWVDLEAVQPLPRANEFRREMGWVDRFVVLFAGNLGFASGLESVLEAAALVRDVPRILFVIVGEGSAKKALERRATVLDLKNVIFLPTQPADRLGLVYATADLSLVTLRRGMGLLSVPSKAYAIMASARAMLASVPEDSEVRRLVENANCGRWVGPEDAGAIAEAIRLLMARPGELDTFGANGRRWVELHHARPDSVSQYHQRLAEAAQKLDPVD